MHPRWSEAVAFMPQVAIVGVGVVSVAALVLPLRALPAAFLRPGSGWQARPGWAAATLLATYGARALPAGFGLAAVGLSSCWLAATLWSRFAPERLAPAAPAKRPWLSRALLVLPGGVAIALTSVVAASVLALSAPRTWEARLVCAAAKPGSSVARFKANAALFHLDLTDWGPHVATTTSTWLMMHSGCKVTFDDDQQVLSAELWSAG